MFTVFVLQAGATLDVALFLQSTAPKKRKSKSPNAMLINWGFLYNTVLGKNVINSTDYLN